MKCFSLDNEGDVVIEKNKIVLAKGKDLIAQKIRQILLTNYGEWWLDPKEGINQRDVFKKNPNYPLIKDQIKAAVYQIDDQLVVSDIHFTENRASRHLIIDMKIDGETLRLEV